MIDDPLNELLLATAIGVITECDIDLGRQERTKSQLLLGWLNEHYNLLQGETLVLQRQPWPTTRTHQAIFPFRRSTDATAAKGADPKQ